MFQSGIDAKGAIAILNIGSWDTFVSTVIDHERGQSWFTFNHTWGPMAHLKAEKGKGISIDREKAKHCYHIVYCIFLATFMPCS